MNYMSPAHSLSLLPMLTVPRSLFSEMTIGDPEMVPSPFYSCGSNLTVFFLRFFKLQRGTHTHLFSGLLPHLATMAGVEQGQS